MSKKPESGRGAAFNPPNRFETQQYEEDLDIQSDLSAEDQERPGPRTRFFRDSTRSILTRNDSPDVGFEVSINPYRGCEHGCIYCYARPTHEYLGLSAGVDFESKIFYKERAPALLREELLKPSWRPQTIAVSGVTDCYQPIERKLQLTRQCLKVLQEFRNPVALITKNHLVTRDIDILADLARDQAALAFLSVTTLDAELCGVLEPRTSRPAFRLQAMRELAQAGIPVGVNIAPVIPGLTDHEVPKILEAAAQAGATLAGYTVLRLPHAVLPLFEQWLSDHRPEQKEKILHRVREMRGGKLYDATFGSRMRGEGTYSRQIHDLFKIYTRKLGYSDRLGELSAAAFRRPGEQMRLF